MSIGCTSLQINDKVPLLLPWITLPLQKTNKTLFMPICYTGWTIKITQVSKPIVSEVLFLVSDALLLTKRKLYLVSGNIPGTVFPNVWVTKSEEGYIAELLH